MFRVLSVFAFGAVFGLAFAGAPFVDNEVLVKFKSGNELAGQLAINTLGGTVIEKIPHIDVYWVKLPSGKLVSTAVNYFKKLRYTDFAEPNYKKFLCFNPNDPEYSQQYAPQIMKCPAGWDITMGDPNVIIAVIDTGTQLDHEDLASKVVPGYDYSDNDSDPSDTEGHGTHVSGITAAATNNGKGVAGIGFNCKIMPLKIFPNATDAVSASAIIHAVDHGAKVMNMSYGSYAASNTEKQAIDYAWANNVVPVAAAGNDNISTKLYPAGFDNCVAVGSTNNTDNKSSFSNFGSWVDVGAPGSNIHSTFLGGGYANLDGTSMASPACAGAVGLLWSFAPSGTTAAEIRQALESNTDPIPGNPFNHGRVNVKKALDSAVIAPPINEGAVTVSLFQGSSATGDVTMIHTVDGVSFKVNSGTQTNVGQVGAAEAKFVLDRPASQIRTVSVQVRLTGPSEASAFLYAYNYSTGKYDYLRAFGLVPNGAVVHTYQFSSTGFSKYISPTREMKIVTRGVNPIRRVGVGPRPAPAAFALQADLVQVQIKAKS